MRESLGKPAFVPISGDDWDYRLPVREHRDGRRCHQARRITFVGDRVKTDKRYDLGCFSTFESFDEPWVKTTDPDRTITYRPKR